METEKNTNFIDKNAKKIVILILVLGIILRFVFILTTNIGKFQYDTGFYIEEKEAYEKVFERSEEVMKRYFHIDYIMIIFQTGHLPDVNKIQLYHPPLHHIISAALLKIVNNFNISSYEKLETLQILPFIYSSAVLIISYLILKELNINDKYKIISLIILAVYPLNIYMSGMLNNDALLTMLSILSVMYIIKWYKNPNVKNACILAIIIGLGMLTKTSMMISIGIAGTIFIIKLFEGILSEDKKLIKNIIFQGLIFFVIVIPMAMIFPIRNYILFKQIPFGIVQASDDFQIESGTFNERWGIFSKEILNNDIDFKDKNVPSYLVKSSSLFALKRNFSSKYDLIVNTNKITNIIIIFVSIISMLSILLNKKIKEKNNVYILMITTILWLISYIMFNVSFPASCTMHARYIITAIITNIIIISIDFNYRNYNKLYKILANLSILLFTITSIFMPWI